ncbi:hypothetical protein L195_g061918, partial [Trifolium pratense]
GEENDVTEENVEAAADLSDEEEDDHLDEEVSQALGGVCKVVGGAAGVEPKKRKKPIDPIDPSNGRKKPKI